MGGRTRRSRAGCTAASAMGVRTRDLPSRLRRAVGWGRGMEHGIAGRHAGISAGASHQTEELRPVSLPAAKGGGAGARAPCGPIRSALVRLTPGGEVALRLLLGRRIEAEDRASLLDL